MLCVEALVGDILKYGECFLGDDEIGGWRRIQKLMKQLRAYAKEHGYPEVWFRTNGTEWFAAFEK